MSAITLETAQAELDAALAAYTDALAALRTTKGDRTVQRQLIEDLRKQVDYWRHAVDQLAGAAAGVSRPLVATARWTR